MIRRLPIIGVFGSGGTIDAAAARQARAVGQLIARLGAHLLTGAGKGVMEAAAKAFVQARGRAGQSIGIVPAASARKFHKPKKDYPNRYVEIPIFVPLVSYRADWRRRPSRNHVNVFSTDAIVILPGGTGTHNEIKLTAEYHNERRRPLAQRRAVLFGPGGKFLPQERKLFVCADDIVQVERHLRGVLAARGYSR
jgi:uncharacterized protein (TIGR00725 family)